jgi:hypothetical protein
MGFCRCTAETRGEKRVRVRERGGTRSRSGEARETLAALEASNRACACSITIGTLSGSCGELLRATRARVAPSHQRRVRDPAASDVRSLVEANDQIAARARVTSSL